MALSLGKRAGNTIGLPVRAAGTVLYGGLDVINTAVTLPKQSLEIVSNTTGQIKDVLSRARSEKKWYHRIWKAPVGTIMAAGAAVEGLGRAIVNPLWNTTLHTRDVLGNFLVNPGNAIKSVLSDKPVSEFKYEHLKTRDISKKNRVSNLFLSKIGGDQKAKEKRPDDKPKVESKGQDEATKTKILELETKNKNLETIIKQQDTINKQQEETNKKLLEALTDLKKQTAPEKKEDDGGKLIKGDFKKGPKQTQNGNKKEKTPVRKIEIDENEENEEYEDEQKRPAA